MGGWSVIANYKFCPIWPSDAVEAQSLESVGIWMGKNRFQLNPSKVEWLWMLELPGSGNFPPLVLDGVGLPQKAICGSFWIFVIPLHNFMLYTNCSPSWSRRPCAPSFMLGHLPSRLLHGAALEHPEASFAPECSDTGNYGGNSLCPCFYFCSMSCTGCNWNYWLIPLKPYNSMRPIA